MFTEPPVAIALSLLAGSLALVLVLCLLQSRRHGAARRELEATRAELHAQQLEAREQMVALQVAEGEVETQREASREQAQALGFPCHDEGPAVSYTAGPFVNDHEALLASLGGASL